MKTQRQIVAFGGGGFSMESGNPLLDDFTCSLTGEARPRICFLPTASGDADHYIVRFYNAFRDTAFPSHISLFRRERGVGNIRDHLLDQDLIYVGGGSVVNMLAVWRAHGIDDILHEAWERGIVLCGLSAGSLCWFEHAFTGYQNETSLVTGLGMLPFGNSVHFEHGSDRHRQFEKYLSGVKGEEAPAGEGRTVGFGVTDGAALHFTGTELAQVVASRPEARAYRIDDRSGKIRTTQIATRHLGSPAHVPLVAPPSYAWSVPSALAV
ncbi:MAG: peptidase E [Solirubrobacterales bacterium]